MAVNMQELEREHDRRGIKITELERVIKELKRKSKHTPREIVEQCKLRWEVLKDDLLDDIKNVKLTTTNQNTAFREVFELSQQTEAADTILEEFRLEGIEK